MLQYCRGWGFQSYGLEEDIYTAWRLYTPREHCFSLPIYWAVVSYRRHSRRQNPDAMLRASPRGAFIITSFMLIQGRKHSSHGHCVCLYVNVCVHRCPACKCCGYILALALMTIWWAMRCSQLTDYGLTFNLWLIWRHCWQLCVLITSMLDVRKTDRLYVCLSPYIRSG